MNVSTKALRRIGELRGRQRITRRRGLRLRLDAGSAVLRWETTGPQDEDLVVMAGDLALFVDGQTYLQLADYTLDFEPGARGFYLRARHESSRKSAGGSKR
jgi:Fe-S cluster assembly iron-binding protein IscA